MTDIDRMLNTGKKVTLKYLGEVTVKELSLESVLRLAGELRLILAEFEGAPEGREFILDLLSNPRTITALKTIAAACTGLEVSSLDNLGVTDWLRLIAAFKEVIDWEELKELFFTIVPKETFQNVNL